jgi:hypothetical protein
MSRSLQIYPQGAYEPQQVLSQLRGLVHDVELWNRDISVPFDGIDLLQRICVINKLLLRDVPASQQGCFGTRSDEALHCGYLIFGMTIMDSLGFNMLILHANGRPASRYNRVLVSEPVCGMANMLHGKLNAAREEGALTQAQRLWLLVLAAIAYQQESAERLSIEQELSEMLPDSVSDMISVLNETVWMEGQLNGVASELWTSISSRHGIK